MPEITLAGLALLMEKAVIGVDVGGALGVRKAASIVEKGAKAAIGHDNYDTGRFGEWADLADSTIAEKERLGFTGQVSEYDTLLRKGDMAASIRTEAEHHEAVVGSDSQVMVWQECGTSRIPPRPVLAASGSQNAEKAAEAILAEILKVGLLKAIR